DNVLLDNDLPGITIHGHTPNQNLDGNILVDNTIAGNGPDTDEAATPGTAGIAITSVSPIHGTVIAENKFSRQEIAVAWNTPGDARVRHNNFATAVGVYNLGGGSVTADHNWWGCTAGPRSIAA